MKPKRIERFLETEQIPCWPVTMVQYAVIMVIAERYGHEGTVLKKLDRFYIVEPKEAQRFFIYEDKWKNLVIEPDGFAYYEHRRSNKRNLEVMWRSEVIPDPPGKEWITPQ